jgi:hypothetical protein
VVAQGAKQLGVFTAVTATGDSRLPIWCVTVDVAGNVSLAPVQRFVNGDRDHHPEHPGHRS